MSKKKNSLLWKIEGENLPGTSYVFGTMHVKDQRAFRYKELVFQKIDTCDAMATEFNLEEMHQNAGESLLNLPDGQRLQDLIKPKVYKKINKIFIKTTGIDLAYLDNCQPLLITNIISEKILTEDMPFSLDETLWNFAKEQGKILLGIETFEEQMAILKKMSLDFQVKALISMGKNFKQFRRQLIKMTALYEKGDIRQLQKTTKKGLKGMRKILIYDRNHIMANRILELAKEQTIFSAIGAGHLAGKNGVLRLLKLHGLKVKPVKLK